MTSPRFDAFARAAMLGLLAAGQASCVDTVDSPVADGGGGSQTPGSGGTQEQTASGGSAQSSGGSPLGDSGGSPSGGGPGASSGGMGGAPMGVLSEEHVPGLTLEEFTADCDEAGGVVETHAVCGGANSCKGFSYDDDAEILSVHTCRGENTCSGFSCVIGE